MPFFKSKLSPEEKSRKKEQEDFIAEVLKFETPITSETLEKLNTIFNEGLVDTLSNRKATKMMKAESKLNGSEVKFSFRESEVKSINKSSERVSKLLDSPKIKTSLHLPEIQEVLHQLNLVLKETPVKVNEIIAQANQDYASYASKYIPYLSNPNMVDIKHKEFVYYRNKELYALYDISKEIDTLYTKILDLHNKSVLKNVGRDALNIKRTAVGVPPIQQQATQMQSIPQTTSNQNSRFEDLTKLKELLDSGILTQKEFETEKAKILNA